jgi:1-acylglycerone phosphate reductase
MGCTVFASARNVDKMAALEDAIYKIRLDISSDEDVRRTVKEVIDVAGKIDIVVNNAGVDCNGELLEIAPLMRVRRSSISGPVIEVPMNQVASAFETNFFGALRIVQAVAPYMVARKSGLIINTSSIAAEVCVLPQRPTVCIVLNISTDLLHGVGPTPLARPRSPHSRTSSTWSSAPST